MGQERSSRRRSCSVWRKQAFSLLMVLSVLSLSGQVDPTWKPRPAALSFDLQLMALGENDIYAELQTLRSFVPADWLLDQDLAGVRQGYGPAASKAPGTGMVPATIGANLFVTSPQSVKNCEFYIGLRFGLEQNAAAGFLRTRFDTARVKRDPKTERVTELVFTEYLFSYYFSVTSCKLMVPFGFLISTDKSKRLWFSAGIEITPGMSFAFKYHGRYKVTASDLTSNVAVGTLSNSARGNFREIESASSEKKLAGIGYAAFWVFPLCLNLRLSKKENAFSKVDLLVELAPGYYEARNHFQKAQSSLMLGMKTGFRFSL